MLSLVIVITQTEEYDRKWKVNVRDPAAKRENGSSGIRFDKILFYLLNIILKYLYTFTHYIDK